MKSHILAFHLHEDRIWIVLISIGSEVEVSGDRLLLVAIILGVAIFKDLVYDCSSASLIRTDLV